MNSLIPRFFTHGPSSGRASGELLDDAAAPVPTLNSMLSYSPYL